MCRGPVAVLGCEAGAKSGQWSERCGSLSSKQGVWFLCCWVKQGEGARMGCPVRTPVQKS